MKRRFRRTGIAMTITAITAVSVLVFGGVAHADLIKDNIEGSNAIALTAGSGVSQTAQIRVLATGGESEDTSSNKCNIDPGEPALELTVIAPTGVTPTPATVAITNCTSEFPVSFTAAADAVSGVVTVAIKPRVNDLASNYNNNVSIPITITQPVPTNTAPSVSVGGVSNGANYEIGTVPTATCQVIDAEDVNPTAAAVITGTLLNGLGTQTVTCDYTDAGGLNAPTATVTYTVVDTVAPTIGYTLNPIAPNGTNGWYTTDAGVLVHFACEDVGGSGIAACPADVILMDGANQSVTGTATDNAGNTASVTVTGIAVDTVEPTISYTLNPAAPNGANGWYTSDVTVDFTCMDVGGSGIATCPADITLSDGVHNVTGTATDNAGNTAAAIGAVVNIDTVDPTIASTLDPATANAAGWYAADVSVGFTCSDAGSGIATCAGGTTLAEGAGQSVTGTATDRAGNTATAIVSEINIDTTAPTVALLGGPTGSFHYGNDPAAPNCSATDALSGIASCVVTGGGTAVGNHSYLATATDTAGNTSTSTLAYTVLAWTMKGFYAPVDMGALMWNTVKGGSTVPLKFEIFSGAELTSVAAVKSFTATAVACPGASAMTDAIELTTTGGTSLRYDSTSGQFIQNWQTPKKPGTCAVVTMTAQDGSTISANFMLK